LAKTEFYEFWMHTLGSSGLWLKILRGFTALKKDEMQTASGGEIKIDRIF
jgi:hypothetical protein